jgi:hypothetical protein
LKSFLRLAGQYRRFVPRFNKIAAPLHKLLKKDSKNDLEEGQENLFQTLRQKLLSRQILQYSDFSKEFILTTDALNEGAGAILLKGEIDKDRPIAYASHSFNKTEKSCSMMERELRHLSTDSVQKHSICKNL